ncbi:MAG: pilus assembly FimT family protein [Opitutaceae bacterium]
MGGRITSRTGNGGFTLLEILLALAVIALMATVLIGGSARLLAGRRATPDDAFWDAVRRSRKLALQSGRDVLLSYDAKDQQFVIAGPTNHTVRIHGAPPDLGVVFVPADGSNSEELVAGTMIATNGLPFVRFFPDGTCVPFRVQIHTSQASHFLSIDPWTCAPMLRPLNPDGTPVRS